MKKEFDNGKRNKGLKPLSSVIQICPGCGKVDVYKDDGHECDRTFQERRKHE